MKSVDLLDVGHQGPARILSNTRKQRNLKQDDVARKMEVSQARVSYLEQVDIHVVRLHTLARYIEALGGKLSVTVEFPEDEDKGKTEYTVGRFLDEVAPGGYVGGQ